MNGGNYEEIGMGMKNLAESVSESGAGDTSTDNDDINVAVWIKRSAFSGGGCNVLSGGGCCIGMVFTREKEIVECSEGDEGACDPPETVGVDHFERKLKTLCVGERR